MQHIELSYGLAQTRAGDALIRNPLIDLLHAVHDQGSISGAARALALSYRHVWGELKRWEQVLGGTLIVWEKGQAARLSEFGNKLLWAERQAQARLSPQIAALQADLERVFAVAFDATAHVLSFYASHDDALVALREHAQSLGQGTVHLDIRFTGSVDAIRALNEGRCMLAGFHTQVQPAPDSHSATTYRPLLRPGKHKIIGFAERTQGLMLPSGNPLRLHNLADVVTQQARFAQRRLGSGTRLLQQELLQQAGLTDDGLHRTCEDEPSHAAVAQAVASGHADAGLGIASAALVRGLDFIALTRERYYLVCLKSALETPGVQALRTLLSSSAWLQRMSAVADYEPWQCGQVLPLHQVLPWWSFAGKKRMPT